MKLAQLPDSLFKIISHEEKDLELEVKNAVIQVTLQRGEEITIHKWEYFSKPKEKV
jgi:hypothetical protein